MPAASRRSSEPAAPPSPPGGPGRSALQEGENTPDDPQFGFGRALNAFPSVKNVRVVKDGEVQRVGKIAITPQSTGHAPGSTA